MMPTDKITGRGCIVVGTEIYQDFRFTIWPNCFPPQSEYKNEKYQYLAKNPDMIFDVEWNGKYWECKADGYGYLTRDGGEYGGGSIFVTDFDSVKLINN